MKVVKQIMNIWPQARQGFGEEIVFFHRAQKRVQKSHLVSVSVTVSVRRSFWGLPLKDSLKDSLREPLKEPLKVGT